MVLFLLNWITVSLLSGTPGGNFDRLQVVQNALARTVCQAPWASSVTELCRLLHWVPIRQRVEYKLAVITYNTIQTNTSSTLASLIDNYRPTRTQRSSDKHLLSQPFINLSLATKAFSVSDPSVRYDLSFNCRSSE